MLGIEHHHVDPLFRPPLSLAIIAAAIKYVTTVIVMEDPLLMTKSDFIRQRAAEGDDAERRKKMYLGARLLFCFLAVYTAILDLVTLIHGFPLLKGGQRCHLLAMVLAFSPNTVAAIAATFVTEVKLSWMNELPVRQDPLGKAVDLVAILYSNGMTLCYSGPCLLVILLYGVPGIFTIFYCFLRDIVTLPWRVEDRTVWIALPIFAALVIRTIINLGLVIAQEHYVRIRYPELSAQIPDHERVSMLSVKIPEQVTAHVIGYARNMAPAVMGGSSEEDPGVIEEPLMDLNPSQSSSEGSTRQEPRDRKSVV